jgi:PIN domain nuclease of toxin-antitoxin system
MDTPLLLDTCATIWIANEEPISETTSAAIRRANEIGAMIYVSPITAWEIGLLAARGRVNLLMSPERWFLRLLQAPGVQLAEMAPEVLIASSYLPGTPPRDPADRILAATARQYGYALVTRDHLLLDYAGQGHMQALAC